MDSHLHNMSTDASVPESREVDFPWDRYPDIVKFVIQRRRGMENEFAKKGKLGTLWENIAEAIRSHFGEMAKDLTGSQCKSKFQCLDANKRGARNNSGGEPDKDSACEPSTKKTKHENSMSSPASAKYAIAVHVGAGYHSHHNLNKYKKLLTESLQEGAKHLKNKAESSPIDAIVACIKVLEAHPMTNAGLGSNLTESGTVECDSSVMIGETGSFGAVGALKGVHHPVEVAAQLALQAQKGPLALGRIPPIFLACNGARLWAKQNLHHVVLPDSECETGLITDSSFSKWKRYSAMVSAVNSDAEQSSLRDVLTDIDQEGDSLLDTVGAICVDHKGRVAAGVSSGGIAMKVEGRIGEAAMYGCGCWAQDCSTCSSSQSAMAASVSGAGEHIILSMLAKSACETAGRIEEGPLAACQSAMNSMLSMAAGSQGSSRWPVAMDAGILFLQAQVDDKGAERELHAVELVATSSSRSFGIAFLTSGMNGAQVQFLRRGDTLPDSSFCTNLTL